MILKDLSQILSFSIRTTSRDQRLEMTQSFGPFPFSLTTIKEEEKGSSCFVDAVVAEY